MRVLEEIFRAGLNVSPVLAALAGPAVLRVNLGTNTHTDS